jgi:hypothetical protein
MDELMAHLMTVTSLIFEICKKKNEIIHLNIPCLSSLITFVVAGDATIALSHFYDHTQTEIWKFPYVYKIH